MTERHVVVDHVLFVVEDLPASRRLYTAALAPLGIEELNEEPNCVSYGRHDLDDFAICEGSPFTIAAHVAFDAATREEVDAFFEPGVWIQYSDRYYAAFLNDLHGNNVEAVFHSPEPIRHAPIRRGVP